MSKFTTNDMIKEVRNIAKNSGLVFARNKHNKLYHFHDRKTKNVVLSNRTLNEAYNDSLSGYISSYDIEKEKFDGV